MVIGLCGVQFCLWSYRWLMKTWFVNHEYDYRQNWTKQSPLTKLWQNLRKKLDICYTFSLEKKQLTWQNAQQQHAHVENTVHIHRYDMSTVLLHCLITSMMHALSYSCSNHALDNQSPLRISLRLWLKKLDYLTSQVPQWNTLIIRTRYKHLLFPWHTKYSCLMSAMSKQQRTQEHQTEI